MEQLTPREAPSAAAAPAPGGSAAVPPPPTAPGQKTPVGANGDHAAAGAMLGGPTHAGSRAAPLLEQHQPEQAGEHPSAVPAAAAPAVAPPPMRPPSDRLHLVALHGCVLAFNRCTSGANLDPAFISGVRVVLDAPAVKGGTAAVAAQLGGGGGVHLSVHDTGGRLLAALSQHAAASGSAPCELLPDAALQMDLWDSGAGWFLLFPDVSLAQAFKNLMLMWRMLHRAAALGFAPRSAEGGGRVLAPAPGTRDAAATAAPTTLPSAPAAALLSWQRTLQAAAAHMGRHQHHQQQQQQQQQQPQQQQQQHHQHQPRSTLPPSVAPTTAKGTGRWTSPVAEPDTALVWQQLVQVLAASASAGAASNTQQHMQE